MYFDIVVSLLITALSCDKKYNIDCSGLRENQLQTKTIENSAIHIRYNYTTVICIDLKKSYDLCFTDETWRCVSENAICRLCDITGARWS